MEQQQSGLGSIWPHAQAIVTNPSLWRWAYRVVLPMVMSFGIKPAWEKVSQINEDHVRLNRAVVNVAKLMSAAVAAKDRADREAAAWRTETRLAARVRVELVATQKKQDVDKVLDDYDKLVSKWLHQDKDCLTEIHCATPTEAADMALAVRRPR